MKELREEVGTKACTVDKILKSRMECVGQMVKMNEEAAENKEDRS